MGGAAAICSRGAEGQLVEALVVEDPEDVAAASAAEAMT
jgi:hypothetical protein